MALSDLTIKSLKPASKAKKYADGDGLFLFITPSGTKSWRFRYRNIAGIEKGITFGIYPEVSLQTARIKRFEAKQLLSNGKDPSFEKREQKRIFRFNASNQFKSVAEEWFDLNKERWAKKYQVKVWNRLTKYAFPVIGSKPINEVSGLEILEEIIRPIERKGKTETTHKLLQNCSAIFRLALLTKRVNYNPLADLKGILKVHRPKSLPAIHINQLPKLLAALDIHKTAPINKLAIKLLLLTFTRTSELRQAKWDYFDFEKRLWTIPAELMKMRREHLVPLSKQALKVLIELKKISRDSEYLFPSRNKIKNPFMNENVINNILQDMGYKDRMVGHGFRSLASTTLNELGYSSDVIEKQLAHEERNAVRKAYNRAQYLPQRFKMVQFWADHIDKIMSKSNK